MSKICNLIFGIELSFGFYHLVLALLEFTLTGLVFWNFIFYIQNTLTYGFLLYTIYTYDPRKVRRISEGNTIYVKGY